MEPRVYLSCLNRLCCRTLIRGRRNGPSSSHRRQQDLRVRIIAYDRVPLISSNISLDDSKILDLRNPWCQISKMLI